MDETFDSVDKALEEATEGSYGLDRRICTVLGWKWCTCHWKLPDGTESATPEFTRSLDAKLPGELIVKSKLTTHIPHRKNQWLAEAENSETGKKVVAWGATEAIARRRAALIVIKIQRDAHAKKQAEQAEKEKETKSVKWAEMKALAEEDDARLDARATRRHYIRGLKGTLRTPELGWRKVVVSFDDMKDAALFMRKAQRGKRRDD